jgi:pyruvate-formate lyase-activating enzyme
MQTSNALPDITSIYRLPFSKNDNPNGWVEITTDCNLKCPGCYRGCDKDDNPALHEPLEKIFENILEMKKIRNCQIISLSGGEPLLHPDLKSIIRFIKNNGMHPFMHTNGILLTKELVSELKEAGLAGLIIRVDSLSRSRTTTEEELNTLRQHYGDLVASVKGIHLTFLCVVNQDNLHEIGTIVKWSIMNARLVDFVTFIPFRDIIFNKNDKIDTSKWVYGQDLCSEMRNVLPGVQYAAYLGSKLEITGMKWLQSPYVVMNDKILGYTGPKFVELFQVMHHLFTGKYSYKFGKGRSYLNFIQVLLLSLFLSSFRIIALNFMKEIGRNPVNLFRRSTVQLICYIIPPGFVNGIRDECDGCPDAMLYEGRLVPSCGLEEYKLHGQPLSMQTENLP